MFACFVESEYVERLPCPELRRFTLSFVLIIRGSVVVKMVSSYDKLHFTILKMFFRSRNKNTYINPSWSRGAGGSTQIVS